MGESIKAQFEVLDERFRSCNGDAWMERLHTGCRWTEGPPISRRGTFDGVRLDAAGRIWAAAGDGLHCFDPDGTLIREAPGAGNRGEFQLRRRQAQSPVHLRHQFAVLDPGQRHRRSLPAVTAARP
jgi:outer membrane protein assembly factor BamB